MIPSGCCVPAETVSMSESGTGPDQTMRSNLSLRRPRFLMGNLCCGQFPQLIIDQRQELLLSDGSPDSICNRIRVTSDMPTIVVGPEPVRNKLNTRRSHRPKWPQLVDQRQARWSVTVARRTRGSRSPRSVQSTPDLECCLGPGCRARLLDLVLGGWIGFFKTSPASTHTGYVPAQSPAPSRFRACGPSCRPATVQTRARISARRSSALRSPWVSPCTRRFPRS